MLGERAGYYFEFRFKDSHARSYGVKVYRELLTAINEFAHCSLILSEIAEKPPEDSIAPAKKVLPC